MFPSKNDFRLDAVTSVCRRGRQAVVVCRQLRQRHSSCHSITSRLRSTPVSAAAAKRRHRCFTEEVRVQAMPGVDATCRRAESSRAAGERYRGWVGLARRRQSCGMFNPRNSNSIARVEKSCNRLTSTNLHPPWTTTPDSDPSGHAEQPRFYFIRLHSSVSPAPFSLIPCYPHLHFFFSQKRSPISAVSHEFTLHLGLHPPHPFHIQQYHNSCVAQRKRAGLITRRSLDRNESQLIA